MCLAPVFRGGGKTHMPNGDMVLSGVLPDGVNQRRQQLRSRVQSLREPIRSRRERFVPGPDVVGSVEERLKQTRSQLMSRDNILSRIRERRNGGNGDGGNGGGEDKSNGKMTSTRSEFQ